MLVTEPEGVVVVTLKVGRRRLRMGSGFRARDAEIDMHRSLGAG
jgi:hypothetical protein